MATNIIPRDSGMGQEPVDRHTGGGFPPARGSRAVPESRAALSGNDKGNPVSTGNGGLKTSLRVKNAGCKDAPGLEKTVNLF